MNYTPTTLDKIDDKLLSISSFIQVAKEKIDKGYYIKAKEYLDRSLKINEELRKTIKSFFERPQYMNEKNFWRE